MVTQAKPEFFYSKEFSRNGFITESTHRRFNNVIADVSSMDTGSLETAGKIIPAVHVETSLFEEVASISAVYDNSSLRSSYSQNYITTKITTVMLILLSVLKGL